MPLMRRYLISPVIYAIWGRPKSFLRNIRYLFISFLQNLTSKDQTHPFMIRFTHLFVDEGPSIKSEAIFFLWLH